MAKKKPVTTKRGQHHKFKSFKITLIKDASLVKIDSSMLRKNKEMFEMRNKVKFEKWNADPSYFRETVCSEFPFLQGKEFSLSRLECTTATVKSMRASLVRLPSEINNAAALCKCEELNRSRLYIKLQAVSSSSVSSCQPNSHSMVEDDLTPRHPSSPTACAVPDHMPTSHNILLNPPLPPTNDTYQLLTPIQTSQGCDEHQIKTLAKQTSCRPFNIFSPSISPTNDWEMPEVTNNILDASDALNQQPCSSQKCIEADELCIMNWEVQMSSNQEAESRYPERRKFSSESANICESTACAEFNGDATGGVNEDLSEDDPQRSQSTPSVISGCPSLSFSNELFPLSSLAEDIWTMPEPEANSDQQPTTLNKRTCLVDNIISSVAAQQTNAADMAFTMLNLNASGVVNLRDNARDFSRLPVSGQQLVPMDSVAIYGQASWNQDSAIRTSSSLFADSSNMNVTSNGKDQLQVLMQRLEQVEQDNKMKDQFISQICSQLQDIRRELDDISKMLGAKQNQLQVRSKKFKITRRAQINSRDARALRFESGFSSADHNKGFKRQ